MTHTPRPTIFAGVILCIIIFFGLILYAGQPTNPTRPVNETPVSYSYREFTDNDLIEAISWVESNHNTFAIGDTGNAVGILQITPIMVDDCNRIIGYDKFSLHDRYNPDKSEEMFRIYTNHYSKHESLEVKARRWNGGPNGELRDSTKDYWRKIQDALITRPPD